MQVYFLIGPTAEVAFWLNASISISCAFDDDLELLTILGLDRDAWVLIRRQYLTVLANFA